MALVPSAARLTLFGGLQLESTSGAVVSFPTRRARRLLAMLVLAPVHGLARETLAEALWPEAAPLDSRHALATELWRLRQVLGQAGAADWLKASDGRISVTDAARRATDVQAFEIALARARSPEPLETRRTAVAEVEHLHAGEFLAGENDEWSLSRRAWFAAQRVDTLVVGLGLARDCADWPEVIRLGQAVMLSDPLLEAAPQEVMRAHLATGNSAAALAVYRRLERVLQTELAVAPMPETQALRDLAMAARQIPAAMTSPLKGFPHPAPRSQSELKALPERLRRLAQELDALSHRLG